MNNAKLKISKSECIPIAVMLFSLSVAILLRDAFPMLLNWFGYVFAICSIWSWKSKTGEGWFSLYTIFIVFFVAFNYGVPLMWGLGIHKDTEFGRQRLYMSSGYVPTNADIIETQVFTCLCMVAFHLGALVMTGRCFRPKVRTVGAGLVSQDNFHDNPLLRSSLKTISKAVLLVVAPIAMAYSLYSLAISRVWGYAALYYGEHQVQSGYVPMLLWLFFPALVGYMIGSNYSRTSQIVGYSIFAAYAVINILTGDRGSWIYSLVILMWLYTQYRKISFKKWIALFLAGIAGLYFLQAIIAVRDLGIGNFSISELAGSIDIGNFPVVNVLFEMGGSMGVIMYLLHTGNGIYPYPNTYCIAILGAVSTRLLNSFGLEGTLLADWFSQDHLHLSYGAGFSMIAEAYVNGGYVGGLAYMAVIGMFFGKMAGYKRRGTARNSPLRLFLMAAGMNVMIAFIRGALYLTLKQLVWGVGMFSLLVWTYYTVMKRKMTRHNAAYMC